MRGTMVFSSMIFIWVFLPIVFILDKIFVKSRTLQNLILLAASLLFYAWGQPDYVWLLLVSILVNYLFGFAVSAVRKPEGAKKKSRELLLGRIVLAAGILANLGILGYYKYFNFFANTLNKALGGEILSMREIALPLGVSFFTFQAVTYLVDLYKGKYPVQKNVLHMALYFSFFPRITQGPIERYCDFAPQILNRKQSLIKVSEGVRRFIYGLAKKVLIADVLGACVDKIYGMEIGNVSGVFIWIAAIFYSLQLYYDFSGYSDMAVGLGKMFGFDLTENFQYPYIASSVTDFWRRWHMSLTAWFREYLYFPMGGSRKGKVRTCINIMIVYMATGLWHGASWDFICWGLYHGVFQIIERLGLAKLLGKTKILKHVYTLIVVCVGWVFFRVGDLGASFQYIVRMFLPWMYTGSGYAVREIVSNRAALMAVCAVLGCGLVQTAVPYLAKLCVKKSENKVSVQEKMPGGIAAAWKFSIPELLWCMFLLAWSIMTMVSSTYSAFIYMTF